LPENENKFLNISSSSLNPDWVYTVLEIVSVNVAILNPEISEWD
jgi:hypothetical protein